jgi:LacI family transcriptional regulator
MDIREIAKRARVSTATVSRTINHVPTVHAALAKRVWKVVEELGYYPNSQARALVSGKSRTFGLIVSEITNPFFPAIVQSFEDLAVKNNYEILLSSTIHDPARMALAVRRMIERRVDGVAVLTFGMEESLTEDLRYRNVPLVFVDVELAKPRVSTIHINYKNGIRQAIEHLSALGHTQVAFIRGPIHLRSASARQVAFEESMQEIGLPITPQFIVVGDHTMEGGMLALMELIKLPRRPSAVLCSNDMTAIGVMRKAYDCGLTIPDELSVVGFDDIPMAQFTTPPLTSVQMSQTLLAEYAFKSLLSSVEAGSTSGSASNHELVTNLVVRKTTARPVEPAGEGNGRGPSPATRTTNSAKIEGRGSTKNPRKPQKSIDKVRGLL